MKYVQRNWQRSCEGKKRLDAHCIFAVLSCDGRLEIPQPTSDHPLGSAVQDAQPRSQSLGGFLGSSNSTHPTDYPVFFVWGLAFEDESISCWTDCFTGYLNCWSWTAWSGWWWLLILALRISTRASWLGKRRVS